MTLKVDLWPLHFPHTCTYAQVLMHTLASARTHTHTEKGFQYKPT